MSKARYDIQQLDDLAAPLRAQHKPHPRQGQLVRRALRQTAGDDDLRLRVLPVAPADDLHALLVARAGHGAGVDDINIRLPVKLSRAIARLFKPLAHGLRIILVHLAPEGVKGDCFLF